MDNWELKPARDLGLPVFRRFSSIQREGRLSESCLRLLWWACVRGLLKIVNRLEVEGRDLLPTEPPFVLAGNHCSHLDALVIASSMPLRWRDCVFPLAAGDTFFEKSGAAAFAATFMNAFPVWRKKASARGPIDLRRRLQEDKCIYIVFPEGTRSRDGRMAPFKAGVGMLVAGTSIPVVPCRLTGTFEALRPGRRFPRPSKIRLQFGSPMTFENESRGHAAWARTAAALEASVGAMETVAEQTD